MGLFLIRKEWGGRGEGPTGKKEIEEQKTKREVSELGVELMGF